MTETTSARPIKLVTPIASVVVMTFNRPFGLRRCLASLSCQTLDPTAFEVVVIDVSSPPVDHVLAEFQLQLRITHQPAENLGVAGK